MPLTRSAGPAPTTPSGVHDSSDAALVSLVARQAPLALEELHRRHAGRVRGSAITVLRDADLAGEVSQEVFIQLWREPTKFDPSRGSLSAFLCMQARRRAIDILRSNGARQRRELRAAEEPGVVSEDQGWRSAWSSEVRGALALLDVSQREPIELAFFSGYTYREVARLLDQPEGTVKSRIRSGLMKLHALLRSADDPVGRPSPTGAAICGV